MNPNAKEFSFNPAAASFTPPTAPPIAAVPSSTTEEVDGDEAIDEDDPLWRATLVIAGGDRKKAVKLLEDPDALMQYPEVRAIMEGSGGGEEEEWEKASDTKIAAESVAAPAPVLKETPKEATKAAAPPPVPDADEGGDDSALALKDSDPREHINLVFIGTNSFYTHTLSHILSPCLTPYLTTRSHTSSHTLSHTLSNTLSNTTHLYLYSRTR